MGTRADFYVGRGKQAEWLGSIAWDGSEIPEEVWASKTERQYRNRIKKFLSSRDDGTFPERGWPWPWKDSHLTDCTYAFDKGRVWHTKYLGDDEYEGPPPKHPKCEVCGHDMNDGWTTRYGKNLPLDSPRPEYPDMSGRQRVTFGARSGIVVIGA